MKKPERKRFGWWWKKGFQLAPEFMLPFRACLRRLRDCLLNFREFRQSSHDFGFLFAISRATSSLATVSVTLRQWTLAGWVFWLHRHVDATSCMCLLERIVRSERQASLQSLQKVKPIKLNYIPDVHARTSRKFNQRRSLRNYKTCKNTFLGFSLAFPVHKLDFLALRNSFEREKVALPRFRMKLSGNLNH